MKRGVISKMGSPAKPGAGFTLFNTLLCKQLALLAKRSEYGSANMKSLAGDGEWAPGLWSEKWPNRAEGGAVRRFLLLFYS